MGTLAGIYGKTLYWINLETKQIVANQNHRIIRLL